MTGPAHLDYARRIVAGVIPASKPVIARCRITLEEHRAGFVEDELHGETYRYVWRPEDAEARLEFIRRCPYPDGRWRAQGRRIKLEPWQVFFISEVFGWSLESNPAVRRFDSAVLFMARKNSKTALAALLALYEIGWGDAGAEAYVSSTGETQSSILFGKARAIHEGMPERLKAMFISRGKSIEGRNGILKPLPANAKKQDGFNPSLAVMDEAAAIEDSNQMHVLESGMGARDGPIMLYTTTAQPNRFTAFYRLYAAAKKALRAGKPLVSEFAMLYELDAPEEIDDPDLWVKANPNLGVSVTRRSIALALKKSEEKPRERSLTLAKNFNVWAQYESAWIGADKWNACAGGVVREGRAYIGLDLAERLDLAAGAIIWDNGGGRFSVDWRFWTPEAALAKYPDDDRAILADSAGLGGDAEKPLRLVPTAVVNHEEIVDWVLEMAAAHDVKRIGLDPKFAGRVVSDLEELGHQALAVNQNSVALTNPITNVEGWILEGALTHPGYPLMGWQVQNVISVAHDGRRKLMKPKNEPHRKIDGVMALVIAAAGVDFGDDFAGVVTSSSRRDASAGETPEERRERLAALGLISRQRAG